jgi:hypothetical protein
MVLMLLLLLLLLHGDVQLRLRRLPLQLHAPPVVATNHE